MIIKKGIKGKNKGGILSILSICMSVLVLSLGSLYFATDKFGIEMFYSYFRNPYMQIMLKRNASSATAERLFHF